MILRHFPLILFGALLGVLGIEIVLHNLGPQFVGGAGIWRQELLPTFDANSGRYVGHPYSAYAFRGPLQTREFYSGSNKEGENFINSEGFRNKEEFSKSHLGTFRVLCLGSSTTYGIRNVYEKSYPYQLEQILKERTGKKVEVINAGLTSATTAEHIARLPHQVTPFRPDVVIIYEGFNDLVPRVFNNFRSDYSHFRVTPTAKVPRFISKIINSFFTLRFFAYSYHLAPFLNDYTMNFKNIPASEEDRIKNFARNGPETFEENLNYLIKTLGAFDIPVILPTFAFSSRGDDSWVPMFPEELWGPGINQNNAIILKLQRTFNLPAVDPFLAFSGRGELFLGKIHFTDFGNEELAKLLSDAVESKLLKRPAL